MFFRDLVFKPTQPKHISRAEIRLPVRLGHRDADEAFGKPLARQLAAAGIGSVTEVKSHEAGPSEICGVTLRISLSDASRPTLETVAAMLEHLHAPAGSSIRLAKGGDPVMFGTSEGLEISVENDHARTADARRNLARACASAMNGYAISRGWARKSGHTVFYFYGESFHRMQDSVLDLIEEDPLLHTAKARRLA